MSDNLWLGANNDNPEFSCSVNENGGYTITGVGDITTFKEAGITMH